MGQERQVPAARAPAAGPVSPRVPPAVRSGYQGLLELQRRAGNRAVMAMLAARTGSVVQRRVDQTYTQFEATRLPTELKKNKIAAYLGVVKSEIDKLPAERVAVLKASFNATGKEFMRIRTAATDAELDTFVGDWVDGLVAEVNKVFDAMAGEAEVVVEEAPEVAWAYSAGDLAADKPKGGDTDLARLIAACSSEVHLSKSRTLVGGQSVRSKQAKKIDTTNGTARIDVQNSPGKGLFNVQYQIGTDSYANVIFADEDSRERVLSELVESYNQTMKATSPAAAALLGERRPAKELGSKKKAKSALK